MIAVLAVSYGVMPLVEKMGWTMSAVIFGIMGMILILITFFGTKERTTGGEEPKKQKLPISALMFALVADVVDYGEQKTGTRIDGMTYSATSFGMKVGTGIGTAVLGWVLAFGGYNGSLAVQSETAITSIISLYSYIPLVLTLVGTVILYFTNLDKAHLGEKGRTSV